MDDKMKTQDFSRKGSEGCVVTSNALVHINTNAATSNWLRGSLTRAKMPHEKVSYSRKGELITGCWLEISTINVCICPLDLGFLTEVSGNWWRRPCNWTHINGWNVQVGPKFSFLFDDTQHCKNSIIYNANTYCCHFQAWEYFDRQILWNNLLSRSYNRFTGSGQDINIMISRPQSREFESPTAEGLPRIDSHCWPQLISCKRCVVASLKR